MCGWGEQEHRGQMLAVGGCKNWHQCHLVSPAASCDPRERQHLLLVSQLLMVSLNKHKIPHELFFHPLKFALISVKFVNGKSTYLSNSGWVEAFCCCLTFSPGLA